MTNTTHTERERIARLIDPDEWAAFDRGLITTRGRLISPTDGLRERHCKRSLAKADAILAGRPSPPADVGELVERLREGAGILDEVDRKIFQGSIPTKPGPSQAYKEAETLREAATTITTLSADLARVTAENEAVADLCEASSATLAEGGFTDIADLLLKHIALIDLLQAVTADLEAVSEGVRDAAVWFREYESSHLAKGTDDGNDKAGRNRERAEKLEALLSPPRGAG